MYKKCPLYVWQCNQGTKNNGMAMPMGMLLGQVLSEIFMITRINRLNTILEEMPMIAFVLYSWII